MNNIVLVEFPWTLHRVYKVPKDLRVEVMRALWSTDEVDFADYLIWLVGNPTGCGRL